MMTIGEIRIFKITGNRFRIFAIFSESNSTNMGSKKQEYRSVASSDFKLLIRRRTDP